MVLLPWAFAALGTVWPVHNRFTYVTLASFSDPPGPQTVEKNLSSTHSTYILVGTIQIALAIRTVNVKNFGFDKGSKLSRLL